MAWTAIEDDEQVRAALMQLLMRFVGQRSCAGEPLMGVPWLHDEERLWCLVSVAKDSRKALRRHRYHEIGFGRPPARRDTVTVSANLPSSGLFRGYAGRFAIDQEGRRWLLHDGRTSPGGIQVSKTALARVLEDTRVPVHFSDGKEALYYRIASLEAPEMVAGIETFVAGCEAIRHPAPAGEAQAHDGSGAVGRVGPPPTSGSTAPRHFDPSKSAYCYVFRFGKSKTWKVGWSSDPTRRLAEVNAYLPFEVVTDRWTIFHNPVRLPTAWRAYDFEQWMHQDVLANFKREREQVVCDPEIMLRALERLKKEALTPESDVVPRLVRGDAFSRTPTEPAPARRWSGR